MTTESEEIQSHLESSSAAAPRLFALVVAIDKYLHPEHSDLIGCKNDGNRFVTYLTDGLGVPRSHIVFLADEAATEDAIRREFDRFLIYNADIQRDDAIVFFFAGHGRRLGAPPGWVTESGGIEVLCPHDVQMVGEDGEELWGIFDREIDGRMRHLASEKGDNIIAVFDCCFSGGLARDKDGTLRIRALPPPPYPPPADLCQRIRSSFPESNTRAAETVIQTGFQYKAMASHVVLAACRPDEFAMENPKGEPGGLFTTALIEGLRNHSLHDTSYVKLFEKMDLKQQRQHPQCDGMNKERLLFSVNMLRDGRTMFKVSENNNRLYVSAGSVHGIVVGTEFTINSSTQTLALKAKKVSAFETRLEGTHHNITDATAFVSHWNRLMLRVHSSIHSPSTHITVVPVDEPADVALRQKDDSKWELERLDPLIPVYSDPVVHFDADGTRMSNILDTIANFNSYLYRSDGAAASFAGKVKTRLNRVDETQGEFGPVGNDLLQATRSSYAGVDVKDVKVATITDLGSQYCLTLENYSDIDLFPYFFYFDPSNYEIQAWYIPPSSTMSAPLKKCNADGKPSLFAFGYGGFGTEPIQFYLPPGKKTDAVFLKVFLTTTYVDMTHVAQSGIDMASSSRWWTQPQGSTWASETFIFICEQP